MAQPWQRDPLKDHPTRAGTRVNTGGIGSLTARRISLAPDPRHGASTTKRSRDATSKRGSSDKDDDDEDKDEDDDDDDGDKGGEAAFAA
jgi:hypothetical protein